MFFSTASIASSHTGVSFLGDRTPAHKKAAHFSGEGVQPCNSGYSISVCAVIYQYFRHLLEAQSVRRGESGGITREPVGEDLVHLALINPDEDALIGFEQVRELTA